jgi:hypothetical protein
MSDRPTPDTDAAWQADKDTVFRVETSRRIERERDEAGELLASEKITRNHIIKRSVEVERERDEARGALMEIEDRCVDCEDACDDIQKIREIAVKALEAAK